MARVTYFLLSCGMVLCVLVACERQAYAYVDPGSGLFLLQGIGTAFMGVLYVVRRKLKMIGKAKNGLASSAEGGPSLESAGEAQ